MTDRRNRFCFGLRRERRVRERCGVGPYACAFAGCGGRDLVRRADRLGLGVTRVVCAHAGRGHAAVVRRPLIGRLTPAVSACRDVRLGPGLGFKARLGKRRGVGGLARLRAGRLLSDFARRADGFSLDCATDGAGMRRRHAAVVRRPFIACRTEGVRRKVYLDNDVVIRHREGLCAVIPAEVGQIDLFA